MDTIVVLDFGGQTAHLIVRRIRELGVYAEAIPGDCAFGNVPGAVDWSAVRGLVLSGGPASVGDVDAPLLDRGFLDSGLPVLGICYGLQRMTRDLGGRVASPVLREFGRTTLKRLDPPPALGLFRGIPAREFSVWMSHGDSINEPAPGFQVTAESANGHIAAVAHNSRPLYGIQFHPEVSHGEYGQEILSNFVIDICGADPAWNMSAYIDEAGAEIRQKAGSRPVLLLISGGVDSTVLGAMLLKCLPPSQVHLMYIDTGLMRRDETAEVEQALKKLRAEHLHIVHAEDHFLSALKGLSDPEAKRRAIGDCFIEIQEREIARLALHKAMLAQGTLYTDMIESGGAGRKAKVIKSHHNVRSPLVEKKRAAGLIIEPLSRLYKDDVRVLGRVLGLDSSVLNRHPFPGPGLAIRIPGAITPEKVAILQSADAIFLSELRHRGLYDKIWQAFALLLPLRSVGVAGDTRAYNYVCALRAVTSRDGMTADVYPFEMPTLLEISAAITNKVPRIGRVVYDISSKPPATIEWE